MAIERKYKADNGWSNFFWGIALLSLALMFFFQIRDGEFPWFNLFYIVFGVVFVLSTTIKEYAITELNFLEVRFVLRIFANKRRIAIGDIVGLKKEKENQLRVDKVRGFEILRVNKSDIDALISDLRERNPRIKIAGEVED